MPERVHHSTLRARESDAKLFAALAEYAKEHGYPPTVAELVELTKLGRGSVQAGIRRLKARGLIKVESGHRAITIVEPGK